MLHCGRVKVLVGKHAVVDALPTLCAGAVMALEKRTRSSIRRYPAGEKGVHEGAWPCLPRRCRRLGDYLRRAGAGGLDIDESISRRQLQEYDPYANITQGYDPLAFA